MPAPASFNSGDGARHGGADTDEEGNVSKSQAQSKSAISSSATAVRSGIAPNVERSRGG